MKTNIRTLLDTYQVRKTYNQKTEFKNWLDDRADEMGYSLVNDEHGMCRNLIFGDIEDADLILTAHYDTQPNFYIPIVMFFSNLPMFLISQLITAIPILILLLLGNRWLVSGQDLWLKIINLTVIVGYCYQIMYGIPNKHTANDNTSGVATLLSIMEDLPLELRGKVAFVFFDLEETGLEGSSKFKKRYGQYIVDTPLINFDCVGNGDTFIFVEKQQFRESKHSELLQTATQGLNKPVIHGNATKYIYMSDQLHFKNSVGVVVAKRAPVLGYYLDRIHTRLDTVFQNENVEALTLVMINYIKML
ncbi:Zn-dependent exopeptidase M28 [Erysipelothrix sp. HDW6C]|uniref:M28 family peptidase n=1 Tax=Erysipelothrix sp. HDW6C TaxID=2714930 RepID=UPI001408225F|nr:M28 family peptidase [Erysipelothrix sp. HDW6C]QIK68795.1 Zn-dependent exopeptidase M28 [Erysipelothrix sp. HDW6C]